jgi:hypothetical protein
MPNLAAIKSMIKQTANDAGFELAGVAGVHDFPELEYFPEWIAQGNAGEMAYLQARDEVGNLKRGSLRSTVPWARSVVVCAIKLQRSAALFNAGALFDASRSAHSRMDFTIRLESAGLSRNSFEKTKARGNATARRNRRIRFVPRKTVPDPCIPNSLLRGHWPAGRARVREIRGHRLDWQEHLCHQPETGFLVLSRRNPYFA